MKAIYTLGPEKTDSHNATEFWINNVKKKYQIILCETFEKAFLDIKDGEYIVIPLGYSNRGGDLYKSWVDFHFYYYGEIELVDVFLFPTKPMVLLKNVDCDVPIAIIHSATYQFIKKQITEDCAIEYVNSKVEACERFFQGKCKYTVVSKDVFEEYVTTIGQNFEIEIIKYYRPQMVWGVYNKQFNVT